MCSCCQLFSLPKNKPCSQRWGCSAGVGGAALFGTASPALALLEGLGTTLPFCSGLEKHYFWLWLGKKALQLAPGSACFGKPPLSRKSSNSMRYAFHDTEHLNSDSLQETSPQPRDFQTWSQAVCVCSCRSSHTRSLQMHSTAWSWWHGFPDPLCPWHLPNPLTVVFPAQNLCTCSYTQLGYTLQILVSINKN